MRENQNKNTRKNKPLPPSSLWDTEGSPAGSPPLPLTRDYPQAPGNGSVVATHSLGDTVGSPPLFEQLPPWPETPEEIRSPCYEFIDTDARSAPSSNESGEEGKTPSVIPEDLPPPPPTPKTPRHSQTSALDTARNGFRKDALGRQADEWGYTQRLEKEGRKIIRDISKKEGYPHVLGIINIPQEYSKFKNKLKNEALPHILTLSLDGEPPVIEAVEAAILAQIRQYPDKKPAFIAAETMVAIIWPALDKVNEGRQHSKDRIIFSNHNQEAFMQLVADAQQHKNTILPYYEKHQQPQSQEKGRAL